MLTTAGQRFLGDRPERAVAERHVGQRPTGYLSADGLGDGDVVGRGQHVDRPDVAARDDGRHLQCAVGVGGVRGDGARVCGVGQIAVGVAVDEHLLDLLAPR